MPSLISLCVKYFETKNLYEVLGITSEATEKEVKKAYHKLSLQVHPDRVCEEEKLEATEKFKVLGQIHAVLSNKTKKACYDETGTIDEEDQDLQNRNWSDYWRVLFKKITEEDIINYEKEYIGSQDELRDLKKAYLAGKGDMDYITDHVQFARSEHEPRLRDIVNNWIESGEVPAYKIFTHEPEKKRKKRHAKELREAKEVEQMEKNQSKGNNMNDLALMIKQRQQNRAEQIDSFIDKLAEKYEAAEKKTRTSKRKVPQKTQPAKKRKTKN